MVAIREICKYRNRGWMNQDASVNKAGIIAKYTALKAVSERDILECFEGKDDGKKVLIDGIHN